MPTPTIITLEPILPVQIVAKAFPEVLAGDVDVSVNGTLYDTEAAPGAVNIPVTNLNDDSVGVVTPGVGVKVGNSLVLIKKTGGALIESKAVVAEGVAETTIDDSVVVIKDSAGVILYSKTVKADDVAEQVVNDATVNVRRSDNTLIEAKTVKAQGTESAVVSDSTVNVRKSDGVLIAAVPVKAQSTEPYNVANSTVTMKDTAGATLDSKSVKATESAEFTAPNATAPIKDSAGVLLKTEVFKSGETRDVGIGDSSVAVKDSGGVTLHTKTVKAQGTAEQVVSDSVLTLNSGAFLNVKAQASQNIQLLSSVDDSPILPVSVVGPVIKVAPGGAPMDVDFTANKLTALIAENITFTDLTDNSPTHWSWFFSDGTTAIAQNPVKNFLTLGQKNITLLAGKVGAGGVKIKNSFIEIVGDADAGAFLIAAAITDPTIIAAINVLVIDLKNAGLWSKMKAIYPIVGGSAASHKYNLKDPRDLDAAFRLSFSGGWVHSANGMQGNASNTFANTFISPSAQLNQNSTHLSYYSRTAGVLSSAFVDMGSFSGSSIGTYSALSFNGLIYPTINTSESSGGATPLTNRLGLKTINRFDSSNVKVFNNGVLVGTYARTSAPLISLNIFLGAYNIGGVAGGITNLEYAFNSIGDGLTDAEVSTYNSIVQKFQTTLGRQV
jgi:PKD repeat protein